MHTFDRWAVNKKNRNQDVKSLNRVLGHYGLRVYACQEFCQKNMTPLFNKGVNKLTLS